MKNKALINVSPVVIQTDYDRSSFYEKSTIDASLKIIQLEEKRQNFLYFFTLFLIISTLIYLFL